MKKGIIGEVVIVYMVLFDSDKMIRGEVFEAIFGLDDFIAWSSCGCSRGLKGGLQKLLLPCIIDW